MYEMWKDVSKHTHITRMRKAGQFKGVMKYVILTKKIKISGCISAQTWNQAVRM